MCTDPILSLFKTQKQKNHLNYMFGSQGLRGIKGCSSTINETEIPLPPRDQSNTWLPVVCYGQVNESSYEKHLLYISATWDQTLKCQGSCFFIVSNDLSFYQWNQQNRTWNIVPPQKWFIWQFYSTT
ncbi:hypothetical protein VNO78_05595 [Psophocarpus tetragonolobus]|uniref:Uncharacterized protein n=1 Tax=Psophocarpus tetragonolobus TaxID=3891 RepID=A0AAN9SS09_PSOTE